MKRMRRPPFVLFSAVCSLLSLSSVSAEPAPPNPYQVLDQLGETLSVIENHYYDPVSTEKILDGALRGMVSGLDPHSSYFSSDDLEIFEGDTKGRFGGIGVEVDFDEGEIIVIAPVEGSPAARAGIEAGDKIIAIAGERVDAQTAPDLIRSMRGPLGTLIRLTIRKVDTDQEIELSLIREEIRVASVRAVALQEGVGYFRIKSFQENSHQELLRGFAQLRSQETPLRGIILDLRNNPGGLVREAVAVADEFLSAGVIYSTKHRGKTLRTVRARSGGAWVRGPLVVLINEYSASAAELVAGALKDQKRAIVVGARSFGKGSVQTVLPLQDGAALKLTTALYSTPSGKTLQAQGVEPHLAVDPGYVQNTSARVLRESDLAGHIEGSADSPLPPAQVPPTNRELHLGVARVVPENPLKSGDLALRLAYQIVRGEKFAR